MKEFEDLIAEDGFVEHAKFGGNRYGTSKKMIKQIGATGRIVVLDIEMEVRHSTISLCCDYIVWPVLMLILFHAFRESSRSSNPTSLRGTFSSLRHRWKNSRRD